MVNDEPLKANSATVLTVRQAAYDEHDDDEHVHEEGPRRVAHGPQRKGCTCTLAVLGGHTVDHSEEEQQAYDDDGQHYLATDFVVFDLLV